jgi:hypothetical protein
MLEGLELLKKNHAGTMILKDGSTINYGVISIIDNKNLLYYTGKGLREIWSPNLSEEEKVVAEKFKGMDKDDLKISGHVALISLDQIERVIF